MAGKTLLSVNVDHVATLRQARGVEYPDPLDAARLAERAGASGITIHLRQDRRHIRERDLERIREQVKGKLNLEISTAEEMILIATAVRPDQITLVPERPDEITTEGGLDLATQASRIEDVGRRLSEAGLKVSLFLDPDPGQIARLGDLAGSWISGFEINTDRYTRSAPSEQAGQLDKVRKAARQGEALGLRVYAGHGLTTENVARVAQLPQVEELNIGHSIISRAVLIGIEGAVLEMLGAME